MCGVNSLLTDTFPPELRLGMFLVENGKNAL